MEPKRRRVTSKSEEIFRQNANETAEAPRQFNTPEMPGIAGGVLHTKLFQRPDMPDMPTEMTNQTADTSEIFADQVYIPDTDYEDSYNYDLNEVSEYDINPQSTLFYDEENDAYYEIDEDLEQEIRNERTKTIVFFLNLLASVVGMILIFLLIAVIINLYHWLKADLQNILRYTGF